VGRQAMERSLQRRETKAGELEDLLGNIDVGDSSGAKIMAPGTKPLPRWGLASLTKT
jgi:hypothetical protein